MSRLRMGKRESLVIIVYVLWSFEDHGGKFGKKCFITLASAVVPLQSPPTVARPNSLVLFYLFFENLIQVYVSRIYHTHTHDSPHSLPGLSLISPSQLHAPFYILLFTNLTHWVQFVLPIYVLHGEPTGGKSPPPAAISSQAHSGWGETGETFLVHADHLAGLILLCRSYLGNHSCSGFTSCWPEDSIPGNCPLPILSAPEP